MYTPRKETKESLDGLGSLRSTEETTEEPFKAFGADGTCYRVTRSQIPQELIAAATGTNPDGTDRLPNLSAIIGGMDEVELSKLGISPDWMHRSGLIPETGQAAISGATQDTGVA